MLVVAMVVLALQPLHMLAQLELQTQVAVEVVVMLAQAVYLMVLEAQVALA